MILVVIVMITLATAAFATLIICTQPATAILGGPSGNTFKSKAAAPVAIFENDIYVAWWTNKTGNDEVMYRMSSDAGKTFTDKINLSNTPNSDSTDVEISADEGKVAITWWENSQTTNEPVMRVSIDGGKTFGPSLKLAINGTLGS